MSLVMEALRRVEKVDSRAGSIGATVSSYRPVPKPRGSAVPLLLGLLTGGALVLFFMPGPNASVSSLSGDAASLPGPRARLQKGAAGLPPPLIIEPAARPGGAQANSGMGPSPQVTERRVETPRPAAPPLVLQAISERDSKPIAIINDQLVREGDRIGSARVLRIGTDSVEVTREDGQHEIVRFAPPPAFTPESTPTPTPHF